MSEIPGFQPEQFSLTPETEPQQMGRIIVITGPSGAGKDTVKAGLEMDLELNAEPVITFNTRPQGKGEIDGVDYYFVSEEEFLQKKEAGFFVEDVVTGTSRKGTPKAPFDRVSEGKNIIWRIDMSRAATLEEFYIEKFGEEKGKMLYDQTVVLLVGVSSVDLLRERYKARAREKYNEHEFRLRLVQEGRVWKKYKDRFNNVVLNDGSPEDTIEQAKQIIMNSYQN